MRHNQIALLLSIGGSLILLSLNRPPSASILSFLKLFLKYFLTLYVLIWVIRKIRLFIENLLLSRERKALRSRAGPSNYTPYTADTVETETARLRASFNSGITRDLRWRRQQLLSLLDLINENEAEICSAVYADMHKNPAELKICELYALKRTLQEYADNIYEMASPRLLPPTLDTFMCRAYVVPDPLGVVTVIGVWNYPVSLSLTPLAGAIAGGNCTLLKLPNSSPRYSALLTSLLPRYLDMRCLAVEWAEGTRTIQALKDQDVDLIFFTGSPGVGKILYEAAAKRMIPVLLELGGKNPCIVDSSVDDATLERLAWSKFMNAGQTCIAPDYVLCVEESEKCKCKGETVERIVRVVSKALEAEYGKTAEEQMNSADFGHLASERAFNNVHKLLVGVKDYVRYGGECDKRRCVISPTIVVDPPRDSDIANQEIFGPILPILSFESYDEAIAFANSHGTPLACYVLSQRKEVQKMVLERVRSGGAGINDCVMHFANHNLPFGGCGSSGVGKYHGGEKTFEVFTNQRSLIVANPVVDTVFNYLKRPPYTWIHKYLLPFIIEHS